MNPYPGLRPFDGEYTRFFFGRDRQISELIERLRGNRFVAVVGLSGSGKSSLVRAGLLSALRAGQLGYAGSGWRVATIRPSRQPVATLAAELNKDDVLGPSPERAEVLENSTVGLLEATKAGRPSGTNLLVFVDQFEDVFRLVNEGKLDAQRAAHFINLLLAVPAEPQPDFPVYVVITLRSEYLGSCASYYGLPEALNRSQYLVPRLTPEQLREAMEAPAALTEIEMEPALVQRLLAEASTAPDELPRLQHLLMRLWEHRTGATITIDQYRLPKIGGLEQALDLHAEEVHKTLTDGQKRIARRVFQRLTTWDEASRDARRPTAPSELAAVSGASAEAVAEVVRCFREAHFLTEIPAVGAGEPLLDITHESLIRHWKRLEAWAKEEARYKLIFLALAGETEPLWSDVQVREAMEWRDKLNPDEAWAERYRPGRLSAALGVLKRLELDLSAPARRRKRMIAGLLVGVFLMAGLSGWALWERSIAAANAKTSLANATAATANATLARTNADEAATNLIVANQNWDEATKSAARADESARLAREQAGLALSRQLAAESVSLLPKSVDSYIPAALLAVESMQRRPLLENREALRQSTALMARQVSRLVHQGPVNAVAFSPDGKWLATGSWDETARVMEVATGKEVSRLANQGAVFAVAFSPDGKWVAMGSRDKSARVMEAATGKEVSRLVHQDSVYAVAFSHDGKLVATGSEDTYARVMEAATGKEVSRLVHQGPVNAVAFSPDGKWVATGSQDKTARVMEAATGKEVSILAHQGTVYAVAFSPGGKWVATGSEDNTARVIEAATGKEVSRLAYQGSVTAVAFSPDGKWVATGSDNIAGAMETATGKEVSRLAHQGVVTSVAFSPDGKWVATGSENTARVLEAATGKEVSRLAHQDPVWAVAFSPDGKRVATGSEDHTARVMEAATGKEVSRLAHELAVKAVAFSPDGKWLATTSGDKTPRVMEAATGKEVSRLAHQSPVTAVAFSPDGEWVATGSSDNNARVMEARTGKEVSRIANRGRVTAVAFSPDGKWIATGSSDETTRVMEVGTGKEVSRLANQGSVTAVAFNPNGKWLATTSGDNIARVMEAATGKELVRRQMNGLVRAVYFRGNSTLMVAAQPTNNDIEISHISIDPAELIRDACSRLPRNLTRQEWDRYLPGEPYRATCPHLPLEPKAK